MTESTSSTTTTTSTTTTVIPEVALRWLVVHATTSNVELAHWSNVCRSWRDVVTTVILEQATQRKTRPATLSSQPLLLLPSMAVQLIRVNSTSTFNSNSMTSTSQTQTQNPELPSDVTDNYSTTITATATETFCAAWFAPEGIQLLDLDAEQRSSDHDDKASSEEDEFDDDRNSASRRRSPYGTLSQQRLHRHCRHAQAASPNNPNTTTNSSNQTKNNSKNNSNSSNNNNKHNKRRSKSPMTAVMMNYQQQRQRQQQNQQQQQQQRVHVVMAPPRLEQIPPSYPWARGHGNKAKIVSFHDQGIMVSHEWQGYRHAMQVLHPFGYAECFVKAVLQQAQLQFQIQQMNNQTMPQQQSSNNDNQNNNNNVMHDLSESIEEMNERVQEHNLNNAVVETPNDNTDDNNTVAQTTIAVRGATIARPEGYCLCWEYPASIQQQAEKTQQQQQQDVEWTRQSSDSNQDNDHTVVVENNNTKDNNNISNNNPKKKKNDNNTNNNMVQSIKWQERQRKVRQWKEWRRQLQLTVLPQVLVRANPHAGAVMQFLNVDQKHSVRLLTPKFACGPIGEPVTIVVVGIATEDGCFCSGLHHRFELGHLYPPTPAAELAEMSPICMATDPWDYTPSQQQQQQQHGHHSHGHGDANANDNNTATSDRNIPTEQQQQEQQSEQRPKTPLEEHLLSDDEDDSEDDSEDDYSEDSSSDLADYSPDRRRRSHKKTGWLKRCTCIFQDNSDPCGFGTTSAASVDNNSHSGCGDKKSHSDNNDHDDDDDDDDDNKEDSQTLRIDDDDDDEDEDDEEVGRSGHEDDEKEAERILRGSRIPGIWHCYTAVFDGKKYSTLRVDGVEEILTCDDTSNQDNSKSSSSSAAANISEGRSVSPDHKKPTTESARNLRARQRGPRAMLDGLTIGSDHCFDMTLCFGQGSGGEGEGAIAEIAVFSGRLDTADLEVLEKQLMMKHGIPVPDLPRESLSQEDEWIRSAHALYCQIPPEAASAHVRRGNEETPLSLEHKSVPLRVMAKHRSVAWHQFNSVTGEELRIKRIGSRSAGSSSDW